jgi:hypothetical protein
MKDEKMSLHVTIACFITEHHENIFIEFAPTEKQLQRAAEVQNEWKRVVWSAEISADMTVYQIISWLVSEGEFPVCDTEGETISYELSKARYPLSTIQSVGGAAHTSLIGHPLFSGQSLPEQGIGDGDTIILYPAFCAGGPDPFTIAGGIAAVTQVLLMVYEIWSRRKRDKDVKIPTHPPKKAWDEIKEIRVLMSDGKWMKLDSWLTHPSKVKSFIETFSSPSSLQKPEKVVFLLRDGSKAQILISGDEVGETQLNEFLKYLRL